MRGGATTALITERTLLGGPIFFFKAGAGSSGLARQPTGSHTEHGTSRQGTEPGRDQQGQAPLHDSAFFTFGGRGVGGALGFPLRGAFGVGALSTIARVALVSTRFSYQEGGM